MSKFYAYDLRSDKTGDLYKGHTDNLERRVQQHNNPLAHQAKFTAKHAPWVLVYSEACNSRSEAVIREKFLKSGQGREWLKTVLKTPRPAR